MTTKTKVLVTGAAGFIGSRLVEELLRQGHEVRAFVRYTSRGGRGWLWELPRELEAGLEVVFGDIRDERAVREAMLGCDIVYHLAALIGIPYSYLAPRSYVEVNIGGTLNVLEAARDLETRRVVCTSTSEVYGTALYTPIDEKHPLQGQSPYSASKIAADQLALSYYRAFALPVTIVRPFNTFGPRQSARAVIPTIITQALSSPRVELGRLDPVRDLVFVNDTAAGFIAVAGCDEADGEVLNLATGRGVSIGDLADEILSLIGNDLEIVETDVRRRPEKSEVFELIGSADLVKSRTGWGASTPLEQGLVATIAWIERNLDAYRVGDYCV